ncbi:MAG: SWIM zinc finger family protein [Chitinophagaceae bacterium]|nr:SWIM zinc finger family protein [Chitinophagaceae bacterium]
MSLNLTEEQILNLAPDAGSVKSGKELANPSKWVSKGANNRALWGECQGSGSKPYQTQVDLANIAFKCSCPSRKFPCKHGLGLFLHYSRQPESFTVTEEPEWLASWLSKRDEKQEKQTEKKDKPVDEAAQAKRLQAREQKVNDGIEDLRLWISDIIRNGIISMPEKGGAWFEHMAKRMVDAQAPGLANWIRNLSDTAFYSDGWQSGFMDQLLQLYLLIEGYKNNDIQDATLQQDLRAGIGYTLKQEELKDQPGITDDWLVLAKQVTERDNITTERCWLYGTNTNQYALVLQFVARGQLGQLVLTPGLFVNAELVFYPSVLPLRALIKQQHSTGSQRAYSGLNNWKEVIASETALFAALPFRSERPYLVRQLKPVLYNQDWWLQDAEGAIMQLKGSQRYIWKLLSLSGGAPMDTAILGKEDRFEVVGVWNNGEYIIL